MSNSTIDTKGEQLPYRLPKEDSWRCDGCGMPITGVENHSGCIVRGNLGSTPALIVPPEGQQYGEVISKALTNQNEKMLHALAGLAGEAGEMMDLWKKMHFRYKSKKTGNALSEEEFREAARSELGDILFYVALANQEIFGDSLLELARDNIRKLTGRRPQEYAGVNLNAMRL